MSGVRHGWDVVMTRTRMTADGTGWLVFTDDPASADRTSSDPSRPDTVCSRLDKYDNDGRVETFWSRKKKKSYSTVTKSVPWPG